MPPQPANREHSGLDLEERADLQLVEHRILHVVWAVFMLVLLASAAGLFGQGPLSAAHAIDESGRLSIGYRRFAQLDARMRIEARVMLANNSVESSNVRLWVDRSYLRQVQIERIEPEPHTAESSGESIVYEFHGSPGSEACTIVFHLQARAAGAIHGRMALEGGEPVSFGHFVYP